MCWRMSIYTHVSSPIKVNGISIMSFYAFISDGSRQDENKEQKQVGIIPEEKIPLHLRNSGL
jgi:hypothetical protein